MKLLWKIVIGAVSVLLVLYIISFFLPSEFHIERRMQFSADAPTVFNKVVDLQQWPRWCPFDLQDSTVETSFSADSRGAGAWVRWTDTRRSDGRITIVSLAENKSIDLAIEFGAVEPETGPVNSTFSFASGSNGSMVVWSFWGEVNGPVERYLGLFIDSQLGARFEQSLADLQDQLESP